MRAGRGVRPGFVLEIMTINWVIMHGGMAMPTMSRKSMPTVSAQKSPMPGGCMTCTAMFGNGARTGVGENIHPALQLIQKGIHWAPTG